MGFFGSRAKGNDYEEEEEDVQEQRRQVNGSAAVGTMMVYEEADDRRSTSQQQQEQATDNKTKCFSRFMHESFPVCQPYFLVEDSTGRVLDIPESFAPASCSAFLWKIAVAAFNIGMLTWGLIRYKASFYFAYINRWALAITVLYSLCSVLNTVLASRTPQPERTVGWRIRITWILFEVAAHSGILVTILFWGWFYDPNEKLTFLMVAVHGPVALLAIIDGLYVNRIPVRMMHWYGFVLPFEMAWVLWSYIHYELGIGNPDRHDNDPTTDDDAIYADFSWGNDWQFCLIASVIVLFVAGPIIHALLWMTSLYGFPFACCCVKLDKHKYIDSFKDHDDPRPTVDDVEEGSIFAKW